MLTYTVVWGLLALMLVILAAYRKSKARAEDDVLHVSGSNWGVMDKQQTLAHFLAQIDRWGVMLTIVTVVYGLILLGVYLHNVFEQGQKFVY